MRVVESIGTHAPSPVGCPCHRSSVLSVPGTGGGAWSKNPSFSS